MMVAIAVLVSNDGYYGGGGVDIAGADHGGG